MVQQLLGRVVAQLRTADELPWRPGALELLASLRATGTPCALVSASYRVLLDAVLERLPEGSFAVSVGGDEVTLGKPHPEPYEKACALLGVDAGRLRGAGGLGHRGPVRQRGRRRGGGDARTWWPSRRRRGGSPYRRWSGWIPTG